MRVVPLYKKDIHFHSAYQRVEVSGRAGSDHAADVSHNMLVQAYLSSTTKGRPRYEKKRKEKDGYGLTPYYTNSRLFIFPQTDHYNFKQTQLIFQSSLLGTNYKLSH